MSGSADMVGPYANRSHPVTGIVIIINFKANPDNALIYLCYITHYNLGQLANNYFHNLKIKME